MATATQPIRGYGDIPPALAAGDWAAWRVPRTGVLAELTPKENHAVAARTIDLLPDGDRRKLGWDYVNALRRIASKMLDPLAGRIDDLDAALTASTDALMLAKIADVLASYLPPRT